MNKAEELFQRIKKMRNGEEVICSHCKKGIMLPIGDWQNAFTTNYDFFYCKNYAGIKRLFLT